MKQQVPRAEHAYKKTEASLQWQAVPAVLAQAQAQGAEGEEVSAAMATQPGPRCGASAVVDPKSKKVYVTGGSAGGEEKDEYLSELWVLDCSSADPSGWQWSRGGANGFRRRAWHTSSLVQDKLLVFGGQTDKPESEPAAADAQQQQQEDEEDDAVLMNELTMYDFESGVWFPVYTVSRVFCSLPTRGASPPFPLSVPLSLPVFLSDLLTDLSSLALLFLRSVDSVDSVRSTDRCVCVCVRRLARRRAPGAGTRRRRSGTASWWSSAG